MFSGLDDFPHFSLGVLNYYDFVIVFNLIAINHCWGLLLTYCAVIAPKRRLVQDEWTIPSLCFCECTNNFQMVFLN